MKKLLPSILAIVTVFLLCIPAFATDTNQQELIKEYTIMVNGQILDIRDLPVAPYVERDTIMVPLRKICEALGYRVRWNAETKAITVDDEYIQEATLFNGTAAVIFEGKLPLVKLLVIGDINTKGERG